MKKLIILLLTTSFILLWQTSVINAQGVGINPSGLSPNNSAGLDVNFTNKGFLPPRMTTAQRNLITPVEGLQIYNTDEKCMQFYNGGSWICGGACMPTIPGTISGNAKQNPNTAGQIYSISAVSGATTYSWAVPAGWSITGGAGTTTITVTTGSAGQNGNITVTAGNSCGASTAQTLAVTICSSFTINHTTSNGVAPVAKTVTYGVIATNLSGQSKCWITQNLGSSNQATSAIDNTEPSAGWHWQFNRKQGYKHDGTNRTPNTTWTGTISEASNWTVANDPCTIELGTGWRIPTQTEWTNADVNGQTGGWDDYNEAYADVLKIHTAGYLRDSDGLLGGRGSFGFYWSSTEFSLVNGWYLDTRGISTDVGDRPKAYAITIRCIKD